ncbi:MAG TPA: hypothetical protein VGK58_14245 [Lacipirellulaceae bacterium]
MKRRLPLGIILVAVAGCSSRPGAIRPPSIDASSAAEAAIEQGDRDGDGKLSKAELAASPGLASVASQYDTNGDGALDANEIELGLDKFQQSKLGARSVPFVVTFNGRPLNGATVRLIPEPFLDDALNGASGTTNSAGAGTFDMTAEDRPRNAPNVPIAQPGLYKVEITHPSGRIPPKYNTETTLGVEITSANPGPQGAVWALSSN